MWIRTKTTASGLFVVSLTLPWFTYGYSIGHTSKRILPLRRMWIFKDGKKYGWHRCYSKDPFMGLFMFEGFGAEVVEQMKNDRWKHRTVPLNTEKIKQITNETQETNSTKV